jgi:outer membrane protein TolC
VNAAQRQALATYEAAVADKEALNQRMENEFNSAWASQQALIERVKASNSLKLSALEIKTATDRAIFYGLRTWAEKSNAEMNLARRSVDAINAQLNFYKTQLRFLKMLPVEDPYWRLFVDRLDELSAKPSN